MQQLPPVINLAAAQGSPSSPTQPPIYQGCRQSTEEVDKRVLPFVHHFKSPVDAPLSTSYLLYINTILISLFVLTFNPLFICHWSPKWNKSDIDFSQMKIFDGRYHEKQLSINLCISIPERSYSLPISINRPFSPSPTFHFHFCKQMSCSRWAKWLLLEEKVYRSKPLTALCPWIRITLPLLLFFCQSSLLCLSFHSVSDSLSHSITCIFSSSPSGN